MTAVVRAHRYSVDPADLEELLVRRAAVIDAIRADHPGLTGTRLTRLDDGTYSDEWRWESPEQMGAAFAAASGVAGIPIAMALTRDGTAQNGEIVDER